MSKYSEQEIINIMAYEILDALSKKCKIGIFTKNEINKKSISIDKNKKR